jgi:hypothetical protein
MLTSDLARASSRPGQFGHQLYPLRSVLSEDLRLRGSLHSIADGMLVGIRSLIEKQRYLGKERKFKACIRLDEVYQIICAQTAQKITDIRPDEVIVHYCRAIICADKSMRGIGVMI